MHLQRDIDMYIKINESDDFISYISRKLRKQSYRFLLSELLR